MYKVPFRQAVLQVYAFFGSMRKAAAICKVSPASICRWVSSLHPCARCPKPPALSDAMVASVRAFMLERTRCSALEVVQFLADTWGIQVSRQLAHAIIKRLGFTYKRSRKRGSGPRVRNATAEFLSEFLRAHREGTLVSVDESGFDQRCRPVYAYSLSGTQAVVEVAPCKDHKRHNLLMAIAASGDYQIVLRSTTTTSDSFAEFLASLNFPRGSTILLDNVGFHRTLKVRETAVNKGFHLLFTPPYSPEYNPIELVFGSIKNAFYVERYSAAFQDDLVGGIHRCIARRATAATIQGSFRHVHQLVERRSHELEPELPDKGCNA